MAPARMVAFMETHISQCEECLADPDVKQEAEKIREIVLPPSKVPKPKVVRAPKEEVKEEQQGVDKEHVAGVEDVVKDRTSEDKGEEEVSDSDGEDTEDEDEYEDTDNDLDEDNDLEADQIDDDLI